METRAENFPLFDALRGLGAIAVVFYHGVYQPLSYLGIGDWWWRYAIHLDVVVPMFIAISGFLLYRPFVAARLRGQPMPRLAAFGWRRFLRLVPGYWFALTVLALWFWANPPGLEEVRSLQGIVTFYGFLQIYDADTAIMGIGQAWTLGVEVVFYAALPLWIVLMHRLRCSLRTELLGLATLAVVSIAWKALVLSMVDPSSPDSLSAILPAPTWLDLFVVGMVLAVISVVRPQAPRGLFLAWPVCLVFWLAACWIAGPDGSAQDPVTDRIYLVRHVLYLGVVFFLLVPAVWGTPGRGVAGRVLAWRPVAFVGLVSFSMYLLHFAWVREQTRWWGATPSSDGEWVLWFLSLVAGSIALGTVGYYLVERPFMKLKRMVPARRPDQPGASSTPAAPAS